MTAKEPWHMNRSVPVTLIFAIVLQAVIIVAGIAAAGAYMHAGIDGNSSEIKRNVKTLASVDSKTDRLDRVIQDQAIILARIEVGLKNIQAQLREIKDQRE